MKLVQQILVVITLCLPAWVGATISFVGSASIDNTSHQSVLTIPANAQPGDILVVHASYRERGTGTNTMAIPAGWTDLTGRIRRNYLYKYVLYKRVESFDEAGTSVLWDFDTTGARSHVVAMSVFRGVNWQNPIDVQQLFSGEPQLPLSRILTTNSVNTTVANTMVITSYSIAQGNTYGNHFRVSPAAFGNNWRGEFYDRNRPHPTAGISSTASYVLKNPAGRTGQMLVQYNLAVARVDALAHTLALRPLRGNFPDLTSVSGACGYDNFIVLEFASPVSDDALNRTLYQVSGGVYVNNVRRQSLTSVVLSVTGLHAREQITMDFDGRTYNVDTEGLLGRYHDQRNASGVKTSNKFTGTSYLKLDPNVDFNWGAGKPSILPDGADSADNFSIRWTGYFVPQVTDFYRLRVVSDDGMSVLYDGNVIVNDWSDHGARPSSPSSSERLHKGVSYPIQVEYYEAAGRTTARLERSINNGPWETVPKENFRTCKPLLLPVAHFAFEQSPWRGAGTVIQDYSGNGNTAVSSGQVRDTVDGKVCRGIEIPFNNSRSQQDAIKTNFDLNNKLGDDGTVMFWYRNNQAWRGGGRQVLMDASTQVFNNVADKYFFLTKEADGRLRFAFEDSRDKDFNIRSSRRTFAANTWVHIALSWDIPDNTVSIYINGVRVAYRDNLGSNGILGDVGPMYFGDNSSNYGSGSRSANGRMDDIRIYNERLRGPEIAELMAETYPCQSFSCSLGGFSITQPRHGLACPQSRSEISIQALCADGSAKQDYAGTINLSSSASSLSRFYSTANGSSVINSISLDGSESGLTKAYLFHQNEDPNLRVTVRDSASGTITTASTGTDYRSSGFIASAPGNFVCGGGTSFTLTAIGQDQSGGGVCNVLTGFNGSKGLKIWSDINIDPTGPATKNTGLPKAMFVNGSAISETQPASSNVTANFSAGVASLNVGYLDAGQVLGLNVRHDSAPYNGSTPLPDGSYLQPLSATTRGFVVSPDRITVAPEIAPICEDSQRCQPYAIAGSNFSIISGAFCGHGSPWVTAPSYRGTVGLSHNLVQPAGGVVGTLGVNQVVFDAYQFNAGREKVGNQTISEVGIFSLTTHPQAYFGQAVSGATRAPIGRFYPSYFDVEMSNGRLANSCDSFTYTGQAFGYDVLPSAVITARNARGEITQNYTHPSFQKLDASRILRGYSTSDRSNVGRDGTTPMRITNIVHQGELISGFPAAGKMTYRFSNAERYLYRKDGNAEVAPFTSDFAIELRQVRDSDGRNASSLGTWEPTGVPIRYGRWRAENVFGPENHALSMKAGTEFLANSGRYEANSADSCTALGANLRLKDSSGVPQSAPYNGVKVGDGSSNFSYHGALVAGDAGFTFSAPGVASAGRSHQGAIEVALDLASQDWLRYDWDGDGDLDADDDLATRATFGQYRGHDRIIYWREM